MVEATQEKKGSAWSRLTLRERAFVLAFLVDFNATNAARSCGAVLGGKQTTSALSTRGSTVLRRPKIQRAVEEKLAERGISKESLLAKLAEMALGANARDYEGYVEGRESLADLEDRGVNTRLIKSFTKKPTKHGIERSIELYSALDACKQAGKLMGYLMNKVELTPGAGWLDDLRAMEPEELKRAARVGGIEGEARALPLVLEGAAPAIDMEVMQAQGAFCRDTPPLEQKAPEPVPKQTGTDPQKGDKPCLPRPETPL